MRTLLLDLVTWDLTKDASGNIAVADAPYAIAQDVASACRTFLGEVWYDTSLGLPYFQQILGQPPVPELLRVQLNEAALTVPEVVSTQIYFTRFNGRHLEGQVHITDTRGTTLAVGGGLLAAGTPWYINAAMDYR